MVKIGVIGSGKWGINHLRVFSSLGVLEALSDLDTEKQKLADKYNAKFFLDYKEMLKHVDCVSIVVPTNLHYEIIKECLNAGKHVFVEKPITATSKQAQEVIDLAREKNLL